VDAVADLKLRLERGQYDISGVTDPNVPAGLLKFWLRDLADPLIPTEYYADCIAHCEDARVAVSVVQKLPEINRRVVNFMIKFLQVVADPANQPITKMTVANLAVSLRRKGMQWGFRGSLSLFFPPILMCNCFFFLFSLVPFDFPFPSLPHLPSADGLCAQLFAMPERQPAGHLREHQA
jgi:hypothetical protein